jgi:hypothetical protein
MYYASYRDDHDSDYERDRRAEQFWCCWTVLKKDDSGKPDKTHGLDHMMGILGIEKGPLVKFYDFVIQLLWIWLCVL